MSEKRQYRQYCGLAKALDVVGERWTLLIVRNLLLGPRRYTDLLVELPGITTNLLAKRLKELEAEGLVAREDKPRPLAATAYALTDKGVALEPALQELARWGGRFYMEKPHHSDVFNVGWALLSLKRRYRKNVELVAEFAIDERHFELDLDYQRMQVLERASERAELSLAGSLPSFEKMLFRGASALALVDRGALEGFVEVLLAAEAVHVVAARGAYGVGSGMIENRESYQYLAGVAVQDTADLPEGFTSVVIPERSYAVFTHRGSAQDTPRTMRAILSEHLPSMGLTPAGDMVESYDERFDPQTGRGEIEIWIPVEQ